MVLAKIYRYLPRLFLTLKRTWASKHAKQNHSDHPSAQTTLGHVTIQRTILVFLKHQLCSNPKPFALSGPSALNSLSLHLHMPSPSLFLRGFL